jgi:conjugative transposon TraJ protein
MGTGLSGDIGGLQATLDTVYNTMIVKAGSLIGISSAIAGFATLWYVGVRVWGHISRAESVDIFPLLRPFVIGFAISIFPSVIALINGVMQPTVAGTAALVNDSQGAVAALLQQKQAALQQSNDWQMYVGPTGSGDLSKWEQLSGEADDGALSGISNRVKFEMAKVSYNMKNSIKVWLSEILQTLFEASALCINTVRTFFLIILAILGPLVFGFSVFDGFRHILMNWLARYINVFLWLPIANIFGSLINQIQQEMIKLDIAQLQATGQTSFGPTDSAYLIFLLMAIVGYFTVPSVANYIIPSGGMRFKFLSNV